MSHESTIFANMPRLGEVRLSAGLPRAGMPDAVSQASRALSEACRRVHDGRTTRDKRTALVVTSDMREATVAASSVKRLVATIRPTGCGWGARGGGCTMCGHHVARSGALPDHVTLVDALEPVLDRLKAERIPTLCVYNGGSMLNPAEIPSETLLHMARKLSRISTAQKLVFETRPEFMNRSRIEAIAHNLRRDQRLELALGVESASDDVRQLCLNKGFTWSDVRTAALEATCGLRYYAFLGAPFLTERERIVDTFRTIEQLQALEPTELHIEAATIQRGSLIERLWRNQEYDLPSLWSVIFLLRALPEGRRCYVSPFNHFPMPLLAPTTCRACHDRVLAALRRYNDGAGPEIFDPLECQCIDSWASLVAEEDTRGLERRVLEKLPAAGLVAATPTPFLLETWWSKHAANCEINIGSSGMEPLRIDDLVDTSKAAELLATQLDDTDPPGSEELRTSVAAHYADIPTERCLITVGGSEALHLAFSGLPSGSTVLVFVPCYQPLVTIPRQLGLRVIPVHLREGEESWTIESSAFEVALSAKPDAVVINSPNNPTGMVLPAEVLARLISLSNASGMWLISDESFRLMTPSPGLSSLLGSAERVVVIDTLSKSFGLPGLRIGWLIADEDFVAQAIVRKSYLSLSNPVIDQLLAARALSRAGELLARQRSILDENTEYLASWASQLRHVLHLCLPQGGACCFPGLTPSRDVRGWARVLAERHGVFLIPGDAFGVPDHFRLGLGVQPDRFRRGLERVAMSLGGRP